MINQCMPWAARPGGAALKLCMSVNVYNNCNISCQAEQKEQLQQKNPANPQTPVASHLGKLRADMRCSGRDPRCRHKEDHSRPRKSP